MWFDGLLPLIDYCIFFPGSLLQLNRYDIKTSTKSNGFSLMNHQVFGNNKSSSHLSQFGGLGSLGLTATLARTHFGTIPGKKANVQVHRLPQRIYFLPHVLVSHSFISEWWLSSESHKNGAPTFLSPFLGLNPVIAPTFKNKDPVHLKSYTSGQLPLLLKTLLKVTLGQNDRCLYNMSHGNDQVSLNCCQSQFFVLLFSLLFPRKVQKTPTIMIFVVSCLVSI